MKDGSSATATLFSAFTTFQQAYGTSIKKGFSRQEKAFFNELRYRFYS